MGLRRIPRRSIVARVLGAGFALSALSTDMVHGAGGLDIRSRYSPKNRSRPRRPHTRYIVLHTTEGGERGSLRKVWKRGETHYFVTKRGRIYRIIQRSRIATHAGRSMWEGHRLIDNFALGIEVAGYHNREITQAQYKALRELLRQLKKLYRIQDRNVLTHSMVAYGRPNRFHPYNHRGRKRCGMIFARPDVRERLGLKASPQFDADVQAGRLKVADPQLQAYLFQNTSGPSRNQRLIASSEQDVISRDRTAWDIARDLYDSPSTAYVFPDGRRRMGSEIADWSRIPPGTRVQVAQEIDDNGFEGFTEAQNGESARSIAGEAYASRRTIYIFPSGMIRTGEELNAKQSTRNLLAKLPPGTKVLAGYVYGGHVKRTRLPVRIAGAKWNYPSTFYRFPDGKILSGDEIDEAKVPPNTLVLFQS